MKIKREQALKLRLGGKSYTEIQRAIGVSKSTLSGWLAQVILSAKLKQEIEARARPKSLAGLLKHNRGQTIKAKSRMLETRRQAAIEIKMLTQKDLLLIGAALYWAEGYKRSKIKNDKEITNHPVSLTNSDPKLVQIFLRFLREYCRVPEESIRADIRIYEHQNAEYLLDYWSSITRIRKEKFGKLYYGISKSSMGKRPFNRLPYGTIQIRVNNTPLFHQIMGWIAGIEKFCYASSSLMKSYKPR